MLFTALALLTLQGNPADRAWGTLELPDLCRPGAVSAAPGVLWDGRHLQLPAELSAREGTRPGPELGLSLLLTMLAEDARARELVLEFDRSPPPLLVRGGATERAAARAVVEGLQRTANRLRITLEAWLLPGLAPAPPAAGEKLPQGAQVWRTVIVSGRDALFGRRTSHSFVGDYLVEVANDSGAASPALGTALHGDMLYLQAFRVDAGKRVHVRGHLDLARFHAGTPFDPKTSDLGPFEQPEVRSLQVAFADTLAGAGGTTRLVLEGAPNAGDRFTLWVRVTTSPDAPPGDRAGWGAMDLSLLDNTPRDLPVLRPGAGLEHEATAGERLSGFEGLPPAAFLRVAQDAMRDDNVGLSVFAGRSLLFLPWTEPGAWEAARDLVQAHERARLAGGRLSVTLGDLRADFPVTAGVPARFVAGNERSQVVDYDLEIATETWMPAPDVRASFDGLVVELSPTESRLTATAWYTESAAPRTASTGPWMGELQLPHRNLDRGRAVVERDAKPTVLFEIDGEPATIEFTRSVR